ncbi:MAG TPA: hypothetical protein VFZ78_02030 [Flavisolibacter sp.]
MREKITRFMEKQRVASVCCTERNCEPYCFSCFYVFDSEAMLLYFKSTPTSHHFSLLQPGAVVAGTILPDKLNVMAIRGIQFTGTVLAEDDALAGHASSSYHKKLPFALAMPGAVTAIRLDTIKMTDNTAGFGKKINWSRATEPVEA